MADNTAEILIIGGGIAGCAAALRAVQYHRRICWIRGDRDTVRRSRSQWVANIDNMVGLHDAIVRDKVAKALRGPEHADARTAVSAQHHHIGTRDIIADTLERIRTDFPEQVEIVDAAAVSARRDEAGFVVVAEGTEHRAPHLVLATGVMDRQPSIQRVRGEEILDDTRWIYPFANRETVLYCIRCEGHLTADTHTVVIGSSEDAAQVAMMLYERYQSTCAILTNGEAPTWGSDTALLLDHYQIACHQERMVDVHGDKGRLHTLVLAGGREIKAQFALVSMGLYRVYNDLARQLGAELTDPEEPEEVRHVLIDRRGETTIPGLFAIGDMARRANEPVMKQIYTAQEYAVRAVDLIDARIRRAARARILEAPAQV